MSRLHNFLALIVLCLTASSVFAQPGPMPQPENVILMQRASFNIVAVMDYGHWNFQPTARIMWDFFKQFRRDPETKKLIYCP